MSTDADKDTACPSVSENQSGGDEAPTEDTSKKKKPCRKVCFPDEDHLVTQYFEPANPWHNVPATTRAQLAAEYLECCRRHDTPPLDCVLQQIRELPEGVIGGGMRAPRLTLSCCSLLGAAPCDALEAVFRRVQFRRVELECADTDDEGAEALFDMLEYYESATTVSISGPRHFGIRGWQAASRMIKKSAELSELEVSDGPVEATHAPVLARALRPHTCRLRSLCLQRASLAGEPLLCLVIALKCNRSVRELRICDNRLNAADAAQIGALLKMNTRIQLLDLSNNQIQDSGVGHLADALVEQAAQTPPSPGSSPLSPHHCPLMGSYESRGLAFLVLWNNQLTRNCAHNLTKMVRASKSLCVLNVGRNALGSAGVRAVGSGALLSLGLQGARLLADAAPLLQAALAQDTRLQRIDLRDNRLGVEGLQAILSAMESNTTLTQVDLDDPAESTLLGEDSECATVARLTRQVRAACRRNEPAAASPERRVHRKISLTCHTVCPCPHRGMGVEEGPRGRLRSPAPSPAGSPVPAQHPSRFCVTRVTPERPASDTNSPRASYSAPSRFKVVQVPEPPQIQVQSATPEQSRRGSRFSVTRNVDTVYNAGFVPSPPPTPLPKTRDSRTISQPVVHTASYSTENTSGRIVSEPLVHTAPFSTENTRDSGRTISEPLVHTAPYSTENTSGRIVSEPLVHTAPFSTENTRDSGRTISEPLVHTASYSTENTSGRIVSEPLVHTAPFSTENTRDSGRTISEPLVHTAPYSTENTSGRIVSEPLVHTAPFSTENTRDSGRTISEPLVHTAPYSTENTNDADDKHVPVCVIRVTEASATDNKEKTSEKSDKTSVKNVNSVTVSDKDLDKKFQDKSEALSHDEAVSVVGDNIVTKTETKLVKNSKAVSENEVIDVHVAVTVKKESVDPAKAQDLKDEHNIEVVVEKRDDVAMKQIEAITEDLGHLIQSMRRSKTGVKPKAKSDDCTQTDINIDSKLDTFDDVPVINRDNVVLKKNKSESSLDSPDLEVSRLMNKKLVGSPFCDSSSSLEISGSSMESLNALDNQAVKPIIIQESVESDSELDRRKSDVILSTESSIESTSEVTPVNSGNFLNMSVSSNESVSPIIFGKNKKIHGSLSSLEASVSSLESRQEKVMITSADSGIEYSLQNPSENKEDNSSNEGTLTNNSSLKETVKKDDFHLHETLTCSPKRTSSLLDVPALKTKGLDRMRKISWVAPSASFHIPRPEPEKESKIPGHLEKLLSLFQHPTSIFSRSSEDEKKPASNTPPRKDSSLTSSFWSWGSATEKQDEREDIDSLSEATDSTLSERVQVSFVDESFSKKLDSKTPSTDTDNTLSEFQSFQQGNSEASEVEQDKVTEKTTDDNLVQKCLDLSLKCDASANGNEDVAKACDIVDLSKPNDLNKNYDTIKADSNKNSGLETEPKENKEEKLEPVRPRSFAAVLKASGSENSLDKQSPETGQPVDKLPSKVIRGIKENISPENTLTSTMTKALAFELTEKQVKNQPIINTVWEVTLDNEPKKDEVKIQNELAPIATIEEACDETLENAQLDYIDDIKFIDEKNTSSDSGVTLEGNSDVKITRESESVDLGKDALSYLIYENQSFVPSVDIVKPQAEPDSLAQELRDAEIKEIKEQFLDLSPELIIDEAVEVPEVFTKEAIGLKTSPVIPERAKIKKCNSMEDISQSEASQKKSIAFKVPEIVSTPRDIPERRPKLRSRSGSSPKSLPESLNKPSPIAKMDSILSKKKKKVSSLGKIARDSLLALNMSEEEIAEFRRSYKLTSVESLRSLESVSEDANSQSGASVDSRCRSCLRTSQESLMSLDSINEDCRCEEDSRQIDKPSHSGR